MYTLKTQSKLAILAFVLIFNTNVSARPSAATAWFMQNSMGIKIRMSAVEVVGRLGDPDQIIKKDDGIVPMNNLIGTIFYTYWRPENSPDYLLIGLSNNLVSDIYICSNYGEKFNIPVCVYPSEYWKKQNKE